MKDKIIGPCLNWDGPGIAPCPICDGEVTGRARNFQADSECENGHLFHTCVKHKVYVRGKSGPSSDSLGCTCGKDGGQMSLFEDTGGRRKKKPTTPLKLYSTQPIYAVYRTVNEWGKLGELVCYTTDKEVAHFKAKDTGWFGGVGTIITKGALVVDGEIFVLEDPTATTVREMAARNHAAMEEMKEDALTKLTPGERKALGLNKA